MRSSSHIDGVKKEIIRTLSIVRPGIKFQKGSATERTDEESPPKEPLDSVTQDIIPSPTLATSPIPSPTNFFEATPRSRGVTFSPDAKEELDVFNDESEPKPSNSSSIIRYSRSPSNFPKMSTASLPAGFPPMIQTHTSYWQNRRPDAYSNTVATTSSKSPQLEAFRHCDCFTNDDAEKMKREIISAVTAEVRQLLNPGIPLVPASISRPRPVSPMRRLTESSLLKSTDPVIPILGNGDLYETKLYTQL